mmetsp:Transcript_68817/g.199280  ORF Transcript_68817/g.199280 Transcript_68817/m.199280 type:complete len:205 (+) Transcript_68817:116-730(+)
MQEGGLPGQTEDALASPGGQDQRLRGPRRLGPGGLRDSGGLPRAPGGGLPHPRRCLGAHLGPRPLGQMHHRRVLQGLPRRLAVARQHEEVVVILGCAWSERRHHRRARVFGHTSACHRRKDGQAEHLGAARARSLGGGGDLGQVQKLPHPALRHRRARLADALRSRRRRTTSVHGVLRSCPQSRLSGQPEGLVDLTRHGRHRLH